VEAPQNDDGTPGEEVSQLIPAVPQNCTAGDLGEATVEGIKSTLRKCRGVAWNGALGQVDVAEKWQIATRSFLSYVEYRMTGPDDEEEEEEEL
jgi:3-phosphoglycerate kinase